MGLTPTLIFDLIIHDLMILINGHQLLSKAVLYPVDISHAIVDEKSVPEVSLVRDQMS